MTVDDIRALYHTEPFKPFVFILNDARRVQVERRLWLAISEGTESAWVFSSTGKLTRVNLSDVARIEAKGRSRRIQRKQPNQRRRKAG